MLNINGIIKSTIMLFDAYLLMFTLSGICTGLSLAYLICEMNFDVGGQGLFNLPLS